LEDSIYDGKAFISFMGVDISSIPDATVLCNFRNLLASCGLGGRILSLANGKMERNGLIMRGGVIMDAAIREAPKPARNAAHARNPEMAGTKKHGSWRFGAKSRIGVDAGIGLVHSVEAVPANTYGITVARKL
jgi:IS5 family transposase